MFVDFCLGKEWGTIFVFFLRTLCFFKTLRFPCIWALLVGQIHTTSTLSCVLSVRVHQGFEVFSFLGSWIRQESKLSTSPKQESGWSSSSGIYINIHDDRPHAYIYIIRFFSTIKYMKYNYTHTSSQKLKVYEKDFAFFFPSPKNNSWKKHLTAGQWIVNRSERLTWRCGKTHASRQQRFCRPSHASDGCFSWRNRLAIRICI